MKDTRKTFRLARSGALSSLGSRIEVAVLVLALPFVLSAAFFRLAGASMDGVLLLGLGYFLMVWCGVRFRLAGVLAGLLLSLAALLYAAVSGVFFPESPLLGQCLYALVLLLTLGASSLAVALVVAEFREMRVVAEGRSNLLSKIYNALPIGIWVRSGSGRTVMVNERWAFFCGLSVGDMEGAEGPGERIGLGAEWRDAARRMIEKEDASVHVQRIETRDPSDKEVSLTLLTVVLYIDEIGEYGTLSLLVDETDLRTYRERSRTSEARLNSALDSAGMGFWEMDVERKEIYRDANWYRILDLESTAKTGAEGEWLEQLHPDDREHVRANFMRMLEGRALMEIEYRIRKASGEYIWVQDRARVTSVDDKRGARRVMGIMQEITERKRAEIDLMRAKERADAANKAKGNFIATISHEIRTPLNAIIGLSSFLIDSDLGEEQMDHARTIYSSGRNLLLLVNDILDFSKIESGRLDLEMQEFPLLLCCEDCVKLFGGPAKEKGIELVLTMDPRLPEYVVGDMERLRQIIQNLLSNAIKFTDSGEVELIVRPVDVDELPRERKPDPLEPLGYLDEPDHGYIEVLVKDSGIGIPKDRQGVLFDAFSQADASTTRKYGGTGLGLAICKRLVEAMGGKIWLESRPGEGTVFGFTVRVEFIDEDKRYEPEFTRTPFDPVDRIAEEHPCDILIVGAKEDTERLFYSCRKLGYAPHHAPTYDLSADAFRRRQYNVIFIWLGDEARGLELARQISVDRTRTRSVAIIGVVPDGRKISKERCILSGIRQIIEVKPRPLVVRQALLDVLSVHD